MTEKQTEAAELFLQGYNCAQSVCGAFARELGMEKELLLDMSAAFGGGFARTRNLCGAVSGIGMVTSLSMRASAPQEKGEVYAVVRRYTDRFEEECRSLNCGELLKGVKGITSTPQPDERTARYYAARPCTALWHMRQSCWRNILPQGSSKVLYCLNFYIALSIILP